MSRTPTIYHHHACASNSRAGIASDFCRGFTPIEADWSQFQKRNYLPLLNPWNVRPAVNPRG